MKIKCLVIAPVLTTLPERLRKIEGFSADAVIPYSRSLQKEELKDELRKFQDFRGLLLDDLHFSEKLGLLLSGSKLDVEHLILVETPNSPNSPVVDRILELENIVKFMRHSELRRVCMLVLITSDPELLKIQSNLLSDWDLVLDAKDRDRLSQSLMNSVNCFLSGYHAFNVSKYWRAGWKIKETLIVGLITIIFGLGGSFGEQIYNSVQTHLSFVHWSLLVSAALFFFGTFTVCKCIKTRKTGFTSP